MNSFRVDDEEFKHLREYESQLQYQEVASWAWLENASLEEEKVNSDEQRAKSRKERQLEADMQRMIQARMRQKTVIGLQGSLTTGSSEMRIFNWAVIKAVFYMCFFLATMVITNYDYDFRPCDSDGLSWCLRGSCLRPSSEPVGSPQEACWNACQAVSALPPRGCTAADTATCLSRGGFRSACEDPVACVRDTFDEMRSGLKTLAAFLFLSFLAECGIAAMNWKFSDWHPEQFRNPSCYIKFLLALLKSFPILTQFFFAVLFIGTLNLLPKMLQFRSECSTALNFQNKPIAALRHMQTYMIVITGSVLLLLVLGTYIRCKFQGRGHLHRPSPFGMRLVPCNLDCRRQRDRYARPYWCPDTVFACRQARSCCGLSCSLFASCFSFLVDGLCITLFHPFGRLLSKFWAGKHFIGP